MSFDHLAKGVLMFIMHEEWFSVYAGSFTIGISGTSEFGSALGLDIAGVDVLKVHEIVRVLRSPFL